MLRLTGTQYYDTLNLVNSTNHCYDKDSFFNIIFPSLIKSFNAECATFQLIRGYPWQLQIAESKSFKSDHHDVYEDKVYPGLYRDEFYQCSPLLKRALCSTKTVFKIGESISYKEWQKCDLLNSFILPQKLYWELFLTFRWRNRLQGMITLWRSIKQPNYNDNDIYKAEMLIPHLTAATHNILLMNKVNKYKKHSPSSNGTNNEGIICLDNEFNTRFSNNRAREICSQLWNSHSDNEPVSENEYLKIPPHIINECSALLGSFKADEPTVMSKERLLTSKNGSKFRMECSLISKTEQRNPAPSFVVTLSELSDEDKRLGDFLRSRYHLSKREVDIMHFLLRGMQEEVIAERFYISRLTVHTHIKHIYEKLGVKSRSELYQNVKLMSVT